MSKIKFIELFAKIKKNIVSYISIVLFLMTGIALFCSMSWSGPAFENGLDSFFNKYNFRDFSLIFPLGATEEMLEAVNKVDGVDIVEGAYEAYQYTEINGEKMHVKIVSIGKKVDKISIIKGETPKDKNEIAVQSYWAKKMNIDVGDVIKLNHDTVESDGIKYLNSDELKVTALAESSAYVSVFPVSYGFSVQNVAPIDFVMFADSTLFDQSAYGGYSTVLAVSNNLRKSVTSSEKYGKDVEDLIQKSIDAVKPFSMAVSGISRKVNGGYIGAKAVCGMYDNLKYTMSLLFVIIAILVSYISVSRMVFDDSVLIGTKKALGFSGKEILSEYILFVCSALIISAVLGLLIARFCIQPIFINLMSQNYVIDKIDCLFSLKEFLGVFLVEFILLIIATVIACHKVNKKEPIKLLTGSSDKVYKPRKFEKLSLWQKMSLLKKTIVNNFLSDKNRVFATLVSVLGCVSLIVCGFNFNSGLTSGMQRQFSVIQDFDTVIYYDSSVLDSERNISDYLNENNLNYCSAYSSMGSVQYKNFATTSSLFVFDDQTVNGLFKIYSYGKKQNVGDKVWLSVAFAEKTGLKVGDTITYNSIDGGKYKIQIGGIFEFYLLRAEIIMSPKTYEKVFGKQEDSNVFFVDSGKLNAKDIELSVKDVSGVLQTEDYYTSSTEAFKSIGMVGTGIAILYISLSVIMAFLIVLNILTMFIEEKKRELIIMMINGYSVKEVKKYIYGDTILLTCISVILGIILGVAVSILTLKSLLSEAGRFYYSVSWQACLLGTVISVFIMFIISVVAMKRINNFKLSDINK